MKKVCNFLYLANIENDLKSTRHKASNELLAIKGLAINLKKKILILQKREIHQNDTAQNLYATLKTGLGVVNNLK